MTTNTNELDEILERVENNYLPIYEHPPSYGIQPIPIQNREQAKQAIEVYINQAIQAFGEKQVEAFKRAIYRYELTRDYAEGNLSKPIMEYYFTAIQEELQNG